MIDLAQFHFIRPLWLLALIPLGLLIRIIILQKLQSRNWESICDRNLLPYILIGNASGSRRLQLILISICGLLAVFAVAGPVWEKLPQPVFRTQSALVIALDLSQSMDATDVLPSRLVRARYKVSDILSTRAEGQTALLVYAGDTFSVSPLTDDVATIQSQLNSLTTDIMPIQGNRPDLAVVMASDLLKQAGIATGDILLLTDEVEDNQVESIVDTMRNSQNRISVLGIGTSQGAPIVVSSGGFLKDANGNIVIPILDEKPMQRLTTLGRGTYLKLQMDDADVEELDRLFSSNLSNDELAETELETDVWREQGPWLLVLLIPIAALAFRRGYMVLIIFLCMPITQNAEAFDWETLWKRPDQLGVKALEQGDHKRASELFNDPAWRGSAQYKAGEFDAAAKAFGELEDTEDIYNYGNALARLGQYQQAIAAFDKVLEHVHDHEDAKFNRKIVEDELEQQQQEQQQQEQQQQEQQGQKQQQQQQQDQAQQIEGNEDRMVEKQITDPQKQANGMNTEKSERNEDPNPMAQELNKEKEMEQQQATEQWIRRIPDDPSGLLRRKFLYQHLQRRQNQSPGEKTW